MKFDFIRGLAVTVLLIAAPLGAVSAADMPVKAPAPPPPAAPSWTGFYIGADIGLFSGKVAQSFFQNPGFGAGGNVGYDPVNFGNATSQGPTLSFHAGANYQWSNLVVGLEGDFTWLSGTTTFRNTFLTSGGVLVPGPACPAAPGTCNSLQMGNDAQWLADVRGRLGYVVNNTMIYATGGAAWMRHEQQGYLLPTFANISSIMTISNPTTEGWVGGGGLEYMASQHWVVRAEYLFYSFPGATVVSPCGKCFPGAFSGSGSYTWSRYDLNEVRLGASYKF